MLLALMWQGHLQVLFKPNAKKLQVDIPLNKRSAEYNTDAEPSVQLNSIKLDSTVVDMRTTHAVLTIRQASVMPYCVQISFFDPALSAQSHRARSQTCFIPVLGCSAL